METILINWLKEYTGTEVSLNTKFTELNFDLFDEAVVIDFVEKQFGTNVNRKDVWFSTVKELIDVIAHSS
jgi:acyl carrier protein